MTVFDGKYMSINRHTGELKWIVLPTDRRLRQAARDQLESAEFSEFVTEVLCDVVGCHPLSDLQIERLSAVAFYQELSAIHSAKARAKMLEWTDQ